MTRELAIQKLLAIIAKPVLAKATLLETQQHPKNQTLQMLNLCFQKENDPNESWFTALSVMAVHQGMFTYNMLKKAYKLGGYPPGNNTINARLLDMIATNGKLTKADAG
jgi:hypothetical protein